MVRLSHHLRYCLEMPPVDVHQQSLILDVLLALSIRTTLAGCRTPHPRLPVARLTHVESGGSHPFRAGSILTPAAGKAIVECPHLVPAIHAFILNPARLSGMVAKYFCTPAPPQ